MQRTLSWLLWLTQSPIPSALSNKKERKPTAVFLILISYWQWAHAQKGMGNDGSKDSLEKQYEKWMLPVMQTIDCVLFMFMG